MSIETQAAAVLDYMRRDGRIIIRDLTGNDEYDLLDNEDNIFSAWVAYDFDRRGGDWWAINCDIFRYLVKTGRLVLVSTHHSNTEVWLPVPDKREAPDA